MLLYLELDVEGRKLSLGHKQTTENPWDKYETEFALNTNSYCRNCRNSR